MRTARELAHEHAGERCGGALDTPSNCCTACDRLTTAIEARDQVAVETVADQLADLAALRARLTAAEGLLREEFDEGSHDQRPRKGCNCWDCRRRAFLAQSAPGTCGTCGNGPERPVAVPPPGCHECGPMSARLAPPGRREAGMKGQTDGK